MIKKEEGFTLIEMLIVLSIITVLILLIVPNLTTKTESVYTEGCKALEMTVQSQVNAYKLQKGKFPASLSELVRNDYINEEQLKCKGSDQEFTYNKENGKVGESVEK